MNVNEKILDTIIGDAVDIQRYEATVQRQILKQLKDLEGQIVTELKNSNVITAVRKQTQDKRLTALLKKTRNSIGTAYKAISKSQTVILSEVAELSELQTVNAINKSIKADLASSSMSRNTLNAIASNTLIEGSPTKQWWSRKAIQFQNKFEDTVRMGMMQGQTTDNIVRSLIGTKVNKYKDGALTPQYRGAEAVTRSSIQTVANTARLDTYQNNSDIIKGIEWSSTFDNRTSQICMALDGLQWDMNYNPIGHSKAFVGSTAHWNCRSTQVPITKSWEELGSKVKVEVPVSTRASMDGQVAGGKNYEQWLGTKSKAFQVEVLGVEKQKLWKAGKIGFTDLVNQRGNPLTLAELQNKIKKPVKVVKLQPVVKPIPKPKTNATIQNALTIQLAKNAKDSKYFERTVYREPPTPVGTADLKGLTDEASIMFESFLQEADGWMKKFGVQGIRRVVNTGRSKSIAMMGDGNFYFSKKYFNNYAKTFSADELKKLKKEKDLLIEKRKKIRIQLDKDKEQYLATRQSVVNYVEKGLDVPDDLNRIMQTQLKQYKETVSKYNALQKSNVFDDYEFYLSNNKVSTWKIGDNLENRPWSVKSYTKGSDQSMRSTTLHEFGHQIHQQFGVTTFNELRNPPFESVLNSLFRRKGIVKPSEYSGKNSKEWFAENFSLYARNRKDLVDPTLKDLLQQMEKGIVKDKDTLMDWFEASKKVRFN